MDNEFTFSVDENISVTTQETTEQGRPDIRISTPDKLIYIEVKHESPLGHQQISRYRKALESSVASIKRVVLLTRYAIDIAAQEEKPYKHIRWFEVYNWLRQADVDDPIAVYLIDSFNTFLEVKQMSLQKISWEYINGVPAFNNLVNMLEVAIQGVKIPIYGKSPGRDYRGFWLENKEYIAVIYYNNHLIITFEIIDKRKYNKELLDEPTYELREGKERLWFRLDLEKCHFFSLDKDEQLEELIRFVKAAYTEAQQMLVKE